jgi:LPS sulfotransferase NodH
MALSFIGDAPAYVIAASPRTGSSWLCGLLSSLGNAGFPVEYAREVDERVWRDMYRLTSHAAYFWSLPARSSTSNGVFGLKLLWVQFTPLIADIRRYTSSRAQNAKQVLSEWMGEPLYFWLRRRDRVRQAVSFARAMQTDRWASPQLGNAVSPEYCYQEIEKAFARVSREDEGWATYFGANTVPMKEFWYEDLAKDPRAVLEEVTDALGLQKVETWDSPLQPQADALNEEWVRAFNRDSLSDL